MSKPLHLALTCFEGRADLESPDHGLVACNVPVQFDPVELVFEVHLPASHDVVQELVDDPLSKLNLINVALDSVGLGVRLEASFLKDLSRRNSLIEWPEFSGFIDSEAADSATRCLVLGPSEMKITFTTPAFVSVEHPYQTYYNNACGDVWLPGEFTPEGLETSVHFSHDHPSQGFICSFSDSDFFAHEKRIHAALELIHGRELPLVLKVKGSEISFYGQRQKVKNNYLPLVKPAAQGRPLMDAVLAAMVAMPSGNFEHERYAQIFLLMGKNADVPVEVRYLLMMTCVEAMDGKRKLETVSTSQMLSVSLDSACLLNAMRHQLTHGRGGYREAFEAVLLEQFGNRPLDLEPAFRECITAEHQCDFAALWSRLAERLDAFWCAWLGISESLAAQRYSPVRLIPLSLEVRLTHECPTDPDLKTGQLQIDELTRKNTALENRNRDLNAKLADQGKRYAQLKLQHAACEQTVSETKNPSIQ